MWAFKVPQETVLIRVNLNHVFGSNMFDQRKLDSTEDIYVAIGLQGISLPTELENDRMEKPFKGRGYVYNLLKRGECA